MCVVCVLDGSRAATHTQHVIKAIITIICVFISIEIGYGLIAAFLRVNYIIHMYYLFISYNLSSNSLN